MFRLTATHPWGWSCKLEMTSASLEGTKSEMNSTLLRLAWNKCVKLKALGIGSPDICKEKLICQFLFPNHVPI